jgi:5'-methylthioadenosine phosphorylase
VHQGIERVDEERSCTHCLPHEGIQLPFELP